MSKGGARRVWLKIKNNVVATLVLSRKIKGKKKKVSKKHVGFVKIKESLGG